MDFAAGMQYAWEITYTTKWQFKNDNKIFNRSHSKAT